MLMLFFAVGPGCKSHVTPPAETHEAEEQPAVEEAASTSDELIRERSDADRVLEEQVQAMRERRQQLADMQNHQLDLPGMGAAASEEARQVLIEAWRDRHDQSHDVEPPQYLNRLIMEESPYLLQHQTNPVNWYPWGEEAFAEAKRRDVPIFLSVGYSTCHWCHVMEHESFEDAEVAAVINEHFVPVKVDREERPDVDGVYMNAVQAMTGRGGWPMTVVANPDGEPFFAATYIPARDGDRGASRGLVGILEQLAATWENNRDQLDQQADRIVAHLRRDTGGASAEGLPGAERVAQTVNQFMRRYDEEWGGFGGAPKFPRVSALNLILAYGAERDDVRVLGAMEKTLDSMARGGIYDQAGGGFHRYAVDREWLVSHFEKMLYDNAQLAELYLRASQVYDSPMYARIGQETLDYLLREMRHQSGGFYSATDADSMTPAGHKEEGYYFTWTLDELRDALSPALADLAVDFYGVSESGNFEGRSILHVGTPRDVYASNAELDAETLSRRLREINVALRDYRDTHHEAPHLDDKLISSWNGLTLSAFAVGYETLGDERYLRAARELAQFLIVDMRDNSGHLFRRYRNGERRYDGVLDDYAFVTRGLLSLFEIDTDPRWLRAAIELQQIADDEFFDEESGRYFLTSHEAETLIVREKPLYDGAEPSGTSVVAENLVRLHAWTTDEKYQDRLNTLFMSVSSVISQSGQVAPGLVLAFSLSTGRFLEVALTRGAGEAELDEVLAKRWTPYAVRGLIPAEGASEELVSLVPWLDQKRAVNGQATAFVCEEGRCELPTSDANTFARQLER